MLTDQDLLIGTYRAFNASDIDTVLDVIHPDVIWQNGCEGGMLHGKLELRDYWTRHWNAVDPFVEQIGFTVQADGRMLVTTHQVVRDLEGNVIDDRIVEHLILIENGLIRGIEIRRVEVQSGGT